ATTHFWLATIGIVLYTVSMWAAGLTEGLEWRALDTAGQLKYPNFVDIVHQLNPFYWLRVVGGGMYLIGVIMMAWNFIRSASAKAVSAEAPAAA
ncbi:MAG TPA: cbb3-type cytochrome c oxidase subunit I, partial [Gemmatimonadales bacterium]|nr:cbb3-type cytochrome c oxidase subunit I [Gemmatimonadales bacterium]